MKFRYIFLILHEKSNVFGSLGRKRTGDLVSERLAPDLCVHIQLMCFSGQRGLNQQRCILQRTCAAAAKEPSASSGNATATNRAAKNEAVLGSRPTSVGSTESLSEASRY